MFFFGCVSTTRPWGFRCENSGNAKNPIRAMGSIRQNLPRLRTLPVQVHSSASQGMRWFRWPGHQEVFPWVENCWLVWLTPLNWWHLFWGGGLGILRNIYYINIWYIYYTLPETNIAQVIRFCWWAGFSWLFKMHYGLAHVYGCFQK